jgi:geranylgeranyl diphosphate synthase, type II
MNALRLERRYTYLRRLVDRRLADIVKKREPRNLTDASRYVLRAPGKRIRSTLTILSCEAVGGQMKNAIDAAAAIEMLHNFTLVHDDVMDNAPSRRGRATVHTKWDVNTAILVGDVILGLAYHALLQSKATNIRRAIQLLTDGFIEVSEGQAFDLEYERRANIRLREYYRMISKKTGKLIAVSAELGALLGNGTPKQIAALRTFGRHIGKAFQIQDDLLDVVADERDLGKKIGGDILEGKKTFLLVHALEHTRGNDNTFLRSLNKKRPRPMSAGEQQGLVEEVTRIYKRCGAIEAAHGQIRRATNAGIRTLDLLPSSNARSMLRWMSEMLVQRAY